MRDLTTNDRWWLYSFAWVFAILVHSLAGLLP